MAAAPAQEGKFTKGSTMRHVVVMTATSSVGLVSVFFVDALNLFYISLLGQQQLAAAIGYASTIMFFSISICIGISIAASAVVAKAIGAKDPVLAGKQASAALIYGLAITTLLALFLFPAVRPLLSLLGAQGETLDMAQSFMWIIIPSIPLLGGGIVLAALLRAKGDARRAMFVTLSGGMTALVVDPLLIFGLDLGLTGAAIAVIIARAVLVIVGLHGVMRVHKMLAVPDATSLRAAIRPLLTIATPAILTQLATPVGNSYVTYAMSEFGDDAVAGWAIVGRILPVAFGTIFALTGAVGPILSQNYGARLFPRIAQALRDAFVFVFIYCVAIWLLLALSRNGLVWLFGATGDAASLVQVFCLIVAGSFLFNGMLFVSNAVFNNLGYPFFATLFNWGRATLGIVPFVLIGQAWGAEGVMIGWGAGGIFFGIAAAATTFWVVRRLPHRDDGPPSGRDVVPTSHSPFTSGRAASLR